MGIPPNATIYIKIFGAGEPGRVLITVESDGPAQLTHDEVATVLHQTIEGMAAGEIVPNN